MSTNVKEYSEQGMLTLKTLLAREKRLFRSIQHFMFCTQMIEYAMLLASRVSVVSKNIRMVCIPRQF